MVPFKVKLKVPDFETIGSSMFGQPASEIRHGIYKLICDIQQQIFNFRLDLDVGIDTGDQILNGPSHTLIPRRVFSPGGRPVIVKIQHVICPS